MHAGMSCSAIDDCTCNSQLVGAGYEEYEASEYALAACHLPRTRASSHSRLISSSGTATPTDRQATKWWADGEEPIYYVVSPKVGTLLFQVFVVQDNNAVIYFPVISFQSKECSKHPFDPAVSPDV